MTKNQFTMQNPLDMYPRPPFPHQQQPEPGKAFEMNPKPDHGEESYVGFGRLKGRRALITGADSGIGRATAIAFAREGADLTLNFLPQEEKDAQEVIDLLKAEGGKVVVCPGDLSDESFCRQLIDTTVKELGGIDILVNMAGKQVSVKNIADLTTEQIDQTFRVNIYAMIWLCKFALPHMPAGSSIINTSSIQAYSPSADLIDYAITKAANVNFTKSFAKQVAPKGIRVNSVAPGPIWTPLQPTGGQPPEEIPNFGGYVPLKRPGQPAELAPVYVFLASQESSYVTGETYGVTGGDPLP